jgi:hypothetical protein
MSKLVLDTRGIYDCEVYTVMKVHLAKRPGKYQNPAGIAGPEAKENK